MRGTEQVFKGKIDSPPTFQRRCQRSYQRHGVRCRRSGFSDLKEGEVIEAYTTERMAYDLGQLATTVAAAAAKEAKEAAAAANAAKEQQTVS